MKMKTFPMSVKKYPDEYALYKKQEDEIYKHCRTHIISDNMMLICVLRGTTEETALPTIMLIYDGAKVSTWVDPVVEGFEFVAEEDEFWGAMAREKNVNSATPRLVRGKPLGDDKHLQSSSNDFASGSIVFPK